MIARLPPFLLSHNRTWRRCLSPLCFYSTVTSARVEHVSVPCASNGHVALSIHRPLVVSTPTPSIILYLPPGPVIPQPHPTLDVASFLSSSASATVVQVNYRLSKLHRYPTPVHDVVRAYDWIIQHLVPERTFVRPGRSIGPAVRLGVFGELVGGGLATMLALTECRPQGPHIAAAAVNEPIVDWIFPAEDESTGAATSARSRAGSSFYRYAKNGPLDTETFLEKRGAYFRKPADYFDPFASPVLNFRSPGVATPPTPTLTPLDEFAELSLLERDDFHRQQLRLGALSNTPVAKEESDSEDALKKARKTAKRWPTTGSGLKIPQMHISTGSNSALSDQAVELSVLLQRSVIAQHKKAVPTDVDDWDAEEATRYAKERVKLMSTKNVQLWSSGYLEGLRDAASYFREVLL